MPQNPAFGRRPTAWVQVITCQKNRLKVHRSFPITKKKTPPPPPGGYEDLSQNLFQTAAFDAWLCQFRTSITVVQSIRWLHVVSRNRHNKTYTVLRLRHGAVSCYIAFWLAASARRRFLGAVRVPSFAVQIENLEATQEVGNGPGCYE